MKIKLSLTLACTLLVLAACGDKEPEAPAMRVAMVAAEETNDAEPAPAPVSEVAMAAAAPCKHCKWSNFENKVIPVIALACRPPGGGDSDHCHLKTPKDGLTRDVLVMRDANSEGLSFTLETRGSGHEADRMECVNLVPDGNNARMIRGTCKITNPQHGPGVHHFRAYIAPREDGALWPEDQTPWPEIRFSFDHKPITSAGNPVHNGEGHVHLPGG